MAKRGEIVPAEHETELKGLVRELMRRKKIDDKVFHACQKRHAKSDGKLLRKTELIVGIKWLVSNRGWDRKYLELISRVQAKPIRTLSGVVPVTVLTKPYPCPGECIFCPADARMPKSYLSAEPGAQRAEANKFNPFLQVYNRLRVFAMNGHSTGKVELIVLGGSWSSYPAGYRRWFIKECFRALNQFGINQGRRVSGKREIGYESELAADEVVKRSESYNQVVGRGEKRRGERGEAADWPAVAREQKRNEKADSRCVGLSVETRPDLVTVEEAAFMRRLGVTKVQIGIQSWNDRVLRLNRRGHTVDQTREALGVLRKFGFKLQGHWMANLYGSTPEKDKLDFGKLWGDAGGRVDELKIYPCALIRSAELYKYYLEDKWRPYDLEELSGVVGEAMLSTPRYCRLSRVVRDFSAGDIVAGNTKTNLRELVERRLKKTGTQVVDIRAREVRGDPVKVSELSLKTTRYETSVSWERFIEFVTRADKIVGFCRLSLPKGEALLAELAGCALIRELHVYGRALAVGEREQSKAQHRGLGSELMSQAEAQARRAGYDKLAVIAAVGTREYYRKLGYGLTGLYMVKEL